MRAMLAWGLQLAPADRTPNFPDYSPANKTMNETDFLKLTAQTLSRIEQTLEQVDLDFELPADGILEIEFDDGSKIVINRHGAAREIWVAARSGGFHFSHDGAVWRDTRDRVELSARLQELIRTQGGVTVNFNGPL